MRKPGRLFLLSFLALTLSASFAHAQQALRLGVTAPLSGDFASYGAQIRDGAELAKADLAEQHIMIDIRYEDACLPGGAATAINKLISADHIQGLAANFCVIAMPAMAPALQRRHIAAFHTAGASDSILALGGYIFTTDLKVRSEARKLAEYAAAGLHAQTAGILNISTDLGEDYRKHFTARFEELGGKVIFAASSPIGVNDFRAELTALKGRKPDVIFAAHLGLTLGVLLGQARRLGLTQQMLGTYEAGDSSVRAAAGQAADGLRFFMPEPNAETATIRQFNARFQAAFGKAPGFLEAHAYDSTMLLSKALQICRGDGICARDALQNLGVYDGASGHFSLRGDEESQRDFRLKEIWGGAVISLNPSGKS